MKRFLLVLLSVVFIASCAEAQRVSDDKIYLFYSKQCSYCHVAMEYVAEKHPTLDVEMVDVEVGNGYDLLIDCAGRHNLTNRVGTPLFCIGKEYMMGWGRKSPERFDELVKDFKSQQQ